ncbi:MAG: prolyl oligopeptidase family serine peptidase [Gammaproteobacteria bacterium]
MPEKRIQPYGSWASPITSDLIVAKSIGLGGIQSDGENLYWYEMRPEEAGRNAVVRCNRQGAMSDLVPVPFSARTRVHEYGGGAFLVRDRVAYFSNFEDQRVYRVMPGAPPRAITPEGAFRYADAVLDAARQRLICVREDHSDPNREPINAVVALSPAGDGDARVLVAGADFYSNPRLSPDGRRICWLCWHHPNMPWDGTELWVSSLRDDASLGEAQRIAGGLEESIFQPEWSPDGRSLYFVSDRSGWWNLYCWTDPGVEALMPMEAEFGVPQWAFGESTYALLSPREIACTYLRHGASHLALLNLGSGKLDALETPYTGIASLRAHGEREIAFIGASPTEFPSVVTLNIASGNIRVLKRSSDLDLDPDYVSVGEPIEFPTDSGHDGAHGFFYAPANRDFTAPPDELPPLLVTSHGGPTAAANNGLKLATQFFTSRGFAVLDVNYGGSSGFGRAYRKRLYGQWGVVDVQDCIQSALHLVRRGTVDPKRLAIRGGSAGGFTTLAALTFHNVFTAGASHYGVSDLEALARETHKFESRYLDQLIGAYPARAAMYRARSPIHALERLSCPVIFFQGLEDKVVPPNQAERMVAALRSKGLPVAYVAYEGEQHGFRQAKNIKRTLDAELYFYSRVYGFELAQPVEPVTIENLR